jgi:hypothetical protein
VCRCRLPIRSQVVVAFGLVDFNPSVQRFTLDRIKQNIDRARSSVRATCCSWSASILDGGSSPAGDLGHGAGHRAAVGRVRRLKGLEVVLELEPFNEALLKDVHELVRFVRR